MARSLVLLIIGAMAGAAAVYLLAESNPVRTSPSALAESDTGSAAAAPAPATAPASTAIATDGAAQPAAASFAAERVAVYERVAAIGDGAELEASIRRVAGEPNSRRRDMELGALLGRLAEIDPAGAVRLARGLYLEARLLEPVFETWARSDADAAIDALAVIQPPARQRQLALAVLRVLGDDAESLDRVMAAMPDSNRFGFEVDALIDRIDRDPAGALQAVFAKGSGTLQSLMLQQVVRHAAEVAPRATLDQLAGLDDYLLRDSLSGLVLGVWAESDPAAVFAWIEASGVGALPQSSAVYQALAAADRDRLLAMIDGLPSAARSNALRGVIQAEAIDDPAAAAALLDRLQVSQNDRDMLLQQIAQRWGEHSPELALAWVNGLSPPSDTARMSVLQGIARVDFDRAVDLVLAELDKSGPPGPSVVSQISLLPMLLSVSTQDDADVSRLLDRLIDRDDPRVRSMLSAAMSSWTRSDPDAALNWALAHVDKLDASAFGQIAQQMAQSDVDRAVSTLARLQPEQRAGWLEGVAGQLAQTDIDRAMSLLGQYRGDPGYDNAYSSVVMSLARANPPAAARMLQSAPESSSSNNGRLMFAASSVAREWARRDPAAAADWALTLSDPNAQRNSMSAIAQLWAQTDRDAARNFVSAIASGPARDAALDGLISVSAQVGEFDSTLLDAYSTRELAQRGLSRAVVQIGRVDPVEAERLIDAYITDDTVRQQTRDQLERTNAIVSGSNVIITSGGVLLP